MTEDEHAAETAANTEARARRRNELHDLNAFHAHLDQCKVLRICSVCGEKRNSIEIPDGNSFHVMDPLFDPLEDDVTPP